MTVPEKTSPDDLRREITRILGGKGMPSAFGQGPDYRTYTPAPADSRLQPTGPVGELAKSAAADRGFPREGDPEAVRLRLSLGQADGDMFEALEGAQLDWASY